MVAGLFAANAFAADLPLTLAEAQKRALEYSRQLPAQDLAVSSAREMAVAVSQLPDPVLRLGVENLPVQGPDRFSIARDFMTMRRIGVMQEFTRGEKRQLRAERLQREAEKNLAEKEGMVAAIQRDTALAWLERRYQEAMGEVVEMQLAQARLEVQAADAAYRGGRGSQSEVFAARSMHTMLEDSASETKRRIRNAQLNLVRWTGVALEAPLAGQPAIDKLRFDISALDKDLAHHPQLSQLAKQQEIAETEARLAQANRKSDWSVEVSYSQRGSAYGDMVSFGISVPLQWDRKNRQDRELSAKLAQLEQAKALREEAFRAHLVEVRAMHNEWENGLERSRRYERELIPLATSRTQATLAAYKGGKIGLVEVLAARRNEADVRLRFLQLQLETARLWAQLNFLYPDDSLLTNKAAQ
ncbi:MAG: TolC family protein [Burkholderiales bacterium]|nr:TolC family protein [Burkholderiales bacterium]